MGVSTYARFEYGYKVRYCDIPDARDRFDNEFADCATEPDGFMVNVCGRELWCADLVTGDNAYQECEDQDWYISVPIDTGDTPEGILAYCHENDELVKAMYELVMRKKPMEEPRVHVYVMWC